MKAPVFFDAFSECLVSVAMARKYPEILSAMRHQAVLAVTTAHGPTHAEATGCMFDKLWADMQKPDGKR